MGKIYILLSKLQDNSISYISNTSPLLWTDNKSEAKVFRSIGEIDTDLYEHRNSLEKMKKELGINLIIKEIDSDKC